MRNDFKLKYGPWALIAGASEGLGASFAEILAAEGLHLILIARRKDKLEELSLDLQEKYGISVITYSLDLADSEKARLLIAKIEQSIGLLVYNAAYAPIAYFEDVGSNELERIVDVNIKTPLLLAKLLSDNMIAEKKGGIVLMSSLAGMQGSPKIATYAASKSFNMILSEGLWSELKKSGVDVISSCAGAITTPGYQQASNRKEAPGTLDAFQVAQATLEALGKGPVVIPGRTNKLAHFFMNRIFPRKWAIAIMDKNTKDLS